MIRTTPRTAIRTTSEKITGKLIDELGISAHDGNLIQDGAAPPRSEDFRLPHRSRKIRRRSPSVRDACFAAFVRLPYAHAAIRRTSTFHGGAGDAEARPVLTGADAGGGRAWTHPIPYRFHLAA